MTPNKHPLIYWCRGTDLGCSIRNVGKLLALCIYVYIYQVIKTNHAMQPCVGYNCSQTKRNKRKGLNTKKELLLIININIYSMLLWKEWYFHVSNFSLLYLKINSTFWSELNLFNKKRWWWSFNLKMMIKCPTNFLASSKKPPFLD